MLQKKNSSAFQRIKFYLDPSRNDEVNRSWKSGVADNFFTVTMGKSRFHGTSGLIFHPDNCLFAYTGNACHRPSFHWRCKECQIPSFASFRLAAYKHWPSFLVCLGITRKNPSTARSWMMDFPPTWTTTSQSCTEPRRCQCRGGLRFAVHSRGSASSWNAFGLPGHIIKLIATAGDFKKGE